MTAENGYTLRGIRHGVGSVRQGAQRRHGQMNSFVLHGLKIQKTTDMTLDMLKQVDWVQVLTDVAVTVGVVLVTVGVGGRWW